LTRQTIPILDLQKYPQMTLGVRAGGYVLEHASGSTRPNLTLIATGSEVHLALAARGKLETEGVKARVVSLPCWNLFDKQSSEYKEEVLPPDVPMLAVEAGVSLGWRPYVGPGIATIGVDRFGASAPGETVMREYGFTVEHVVQQALSVVRLAEKA
jgi:transketolase